ncbi:MAG: beta-lactamase family protein [Pseudomonadales bacterium]|nr:beta-lactamase family protein [Pseudomonadales bacterium]
MDHVPIHGDVAPGFEAVAEVFERNFTDDIEVGASFCAVVDGVAVVDLWGGYCDQACTVPWESNTLVNVYSTTKGIAATVVATLVDQGLLDYEEPVGNHWPEFRAAEGGLTVGQFLSHQSGVCGLRDKVTVEDLYDWEGMTRRIAAERPHWDPGTAAGYHAILWGFLAGELVLRLTGKTLGALVKERVADPLGADFHIGLPKSEHGRVADLIGPNRARILPDSVLAEPAKVPPLFTFALQNPTIRPYRDACSTDWRVAEIAAANGHGNARGIARVYGTLARGGTSDDVQVMRPETIARMTRQQWGMEDDLVLGRPMRRGSGINLNTAEQYGPNPTAFGHSGAGGSIGFADTDRLLGVGYAMNQMQPGIEADTRGSRLVRAIINCID